MRMRHSCSKPIFPLPNYSAEGVFQNYLNNGVAILNPRTDTGKLDHNISDKIRLSFTISNDEIPVLSANGGQSGSPLDNIRQLEATTGLTGNARVIPLAHEDQNRISSFLPERFDPAKAPTLSSGGVLTPTPNYDPLNGLIFPDKNGVPRSFLDPFRSLRSALRFRVRSVWKWQDGDPGRLWNFLSEHRE